MQGGVVKTQRPSCPDNKSTQAQIFISLHKTPPQHYQKSKRGKKREIKETPKNQGKDITYKLGFMCGEKEMIQSQQLQTLMQSSGSQMSSNPSFNGNNSMTLQDDEDMSKSALSTFRAKEEEIEKKKLEVRERVLAQMTRIEEETKRLAIIREELEGLADPMKKEVGVVRKKIDLVNKELKPLGQACQKKEKEYKDALEAYNEKNKEKVQLVGRLMEVSNLVNESETLRIKKLDELSKSIESTR